MSKFAKFMKANKTERENGFYAPTKSLCDDEGKPLEWEFRHITSEENEIISESCTKDVAVPGKPNMYRPKLNYNLYGKKLIVKSTIYPDLYDAELQDSYGVKTPEDLLMAMIDDPGEYNSLSSFVQKFQGFNSLDDKVEEAKN